MSSNETFLELLIKNELIIRELYEIFATVFPDRKNLWRRMALDEKKHADWLEILRFDPILNDALLKDCCIKPQLIRSSVSYIEQLIGQARDGHFSLRQALALAKDIENALLEKQFSNISTSVPEHIRSVLLQLAADTQRHRQQVLDALQTQTP